MKMPLSLNLPGLDTSLALRTVGWGDLKAVTQLIYEVCKAEGDTGVAVTLEDLENEWKFEGFNPEQDAFLVEISEGCLAGYIALFDAGDHCDLSCDIYIHPKFKGTGVTTALLGAMETRAREFVRLAEPGLRGFVRVVLDNKDEADRAVLTREGYSPVRYHWRMGIDLDATPPEPVLPAGFEIRPFVKDEHATAVWQARNEAFKGNWGSHALTFEEFSSYCFDNPEYDPTLWVVIWDGDEVAGFSINRFRMGNGWIHILGVRPAWRKKGLGLALLYHSFGEFYKRGTKAVGLGVDASNVTGATRLYQKAGMSTVNEFVMLEKELRAGSTKSERSMP